MELSIWIVETGNLNVGDFVLYTKVDDRKIYRGKVTERNYESPTGQIQLWPENSEVLEWFDYSQISKILKAPLTQNNIEEAYNQIENDLGLETGHLVWESKAHATVPSLPKLSHEVFDTAEIKEKIKKWFVKD